MKKPGNIFLAIKVKALLPGFFVFILFGCQTEIKKGDLPMGEETYPAEVVENVDITYTDSGRLKAILHAPLVEHYVDKNNPYLEMTKGVEADFYTLGGIKESYLRSNYAINYEQRRVIELRDSVYVINIKQETLETEKLIWDQNEQKIHTDAPVKITQKDQIIYGEGFESNQNFTQYTVYKIKGIVNINESE